MSRRDLLLALACAIVMGGCAGESGRPQATGKGTVRAINAISTAPNMNFLIEERSVDTVAFKAATPAREWDDLEYTFNFEAVLAGASTRTRIASQLIDVQTGTDYVLAVTGDLASPDVTLWEAPVPVLEEGATVFDIRFGHLAPTEGPVDVYFDAPGVAPVLGQAAGTIAFDEVLPSTQLPEGEYVLTLTAPGNPDTRLYTSSTIFTAAGSSLIFALFDTDANDLGPISVQLINANGSTARLADAGFPPTMQFIQASAALGTADVYIEEEDETLNEPDLANHAFRDISAELPVFAGSTFLTYTTPMDTAAILFDTAVPITPGTRNRLVMVGDTGNLGAVEVRIDRRSIETLARFSILHTAINHPSVDFYIVERGADISAAAPIFLSVLPGSAPRRSDLRADEFDLYVTSPDEARTVIAGPYALDTALGDVIDLVVFDVVGDPSIAEIVSIDLP